MRDDRPLIVHVLHHLVTGGMENGLVNLVNHLPESEWRHRILCIEDFSDFRLRIRRPDIEVIAMHRSHIGAWRLRRRIWADCRRFQPAVVHTRGLSGLDALVPARLAGVPSLVHSEHGWNVDDLDGAKARPALLRRLHAVFVDHFVVVSRHLGEYMTRRAGVAPARIEQIYNGVDVDRFTPRRGPRAAAAPDGFWGERSLVIGTVGRLQPVKDQATLLDAAAQFIQGHPLLADSLRIVIVGGGPQEVQLRQRAAALGLEGRTWFTGPVSDVPALLSSFDVFVLPSLMEGISNTLLEAMACGLPVVVTAVGGNTELVRDGKNALLFAPRDVERLAEHLARLAADRESAATMGRHSRALAVADFSLETMVRRYGDVYRRMSARSGRSGGAVDPDGATRRV